MKTAGSTTLRVLRRVPLLLFAAACGDARPTGPAPGDGVDLAVTPGAVTLHAYESRQLAVRVTHGGVPVAAEVAWTSSDTAVALVTRTGEVTARVPGTAMVKAASGDAMASLSITVLPDLAPGELRPPFSGDFATTNVFDHDVPREFDAATANGFVLSFWGEQLRDIDGHNGYDWWLPEGTPVLAAAPGVVLFAGSETPFYCPLLKTTTSGLWVVIAHGMAPHDLIYTQYGHLERLDVQAGDRVAAGQPLGLSGSTGCSTGPHLHFSLYRARPSDGHGVVVDPFGWRAAAPDPWEADTAGLPSPGLWGTEPRLFREVRPAPLAMSGPAALISAVRYLGGDAQHDLDGEFVEIVPAPGVSTADLSGAALLNRAGDRFDFPAGAHTSAGAPLRVYTRAGKPSPDALYWGRTSPAWGNAADCAILLDAQGGYLSGVSWGTSCTVPDRPSLRIEPAAAPLDAPSPHPAGLLTPFR